jgi:hypothetical protein
VGAGQGKGLRGTAKADLLTGQAQSFGDGEGDCGFARPRWADQEEPEARACGAAQAARLQVDGDQFGDALLDLVGTEMPRVEDCSGAGRAAVEALMVDDDEKTAFVSRASLVNRLFKAILPDPRANEFGRLRAVVKYLSDGIASYDPAVDVSGVLGRVEQLLDESVAAKAYVISDSEAQGLLDLNSVDWEALQEAFGKGRPRTAAQRLKSLLGKRLPRPPQPDAG